MADRAASRQSKRGFVRRACHDHSQKRRSRTRSRQSHRFSKIDSRCAATGKRHQERQPAVHIARSRMGAGEKAGRARYCRDD